MCLSGSMSSGLNREQILTPQWIFIREPEVHQMKCNSDCGAYPASVLRSTRYLPRSTLSSPPSVRRRRTRVNPGWGCLAFGSAVMKSFRRQFRADLGVALLGFRDELQSVMIVSGYNPVVLRSPCPCDVSSRYQWTSTTAYAFTRAGTAVGAVLSALVIWSASRKTSAAELISAHRA